MVKARGKKDTEKFTYFNNDVIPLRKDGKQFHLAQYASADGYTREEILEFVRKWGENYQKKHPNAPAGNFQVSVKYTELGWRSGGFSDSPQHIQLYDPSDSDGIDPSKIGNIIAFNLIYTI